MIYNRALSLINDLYSAIILRFDCTILANGATLGLQLGHFETIPKDFRDNDMRAKLVFDARMLAKIEALAMVQTCMDEIASVVGCSKKTLERNSTVMELIRKARASGKSNLRAKQWGAAMRGNTAMLIFLGKQYLGQSDKVDERQTVKTPPSFTVRFSDGTSKKFGGNRL